MTSLETTANPFNDEPAASSSLNGGIQWKFKYANGYGASVINDGYGGSQGLFELAVLGPDGQLNYDTPITDDVIGHQTEQEIAALLQRIAELPAVSA